MRGLPFGTRLFSPALNLAAATLALFMAPFAAAQNHVIHLDKPFELRQVPYFENGFFFAPDSHELPGTPMAFLFNPGGSVRQRVAFKRDGMVDLQFAAVAPTAQGGMVVSLAGMATTGRRDFELVWIDPSGRTLRAINTYPFAAELLYATPSGEVWAGGHELTPETTLQKGRDILRHYSSDGRLIGSCLNLDDFPPLKQMNGHPAWNALMFGDGDKVAMLSPNAMEFIVTPAGACEPKRTKITLPEPGAEFTGADLLPGGDLVVSIQTRMGQSTSMALYRWLGGAAAWEKIPAPVMDSGQPWRGRLLGVDGDALWLSAGGSKVLRHPLAAPALSGAPSQASHVSAR